MAVTKSGTLFVNSGEIVEEEVIPKKQTSTEEVVQQLQETKEKLEKIAQQSKIVFRARSAFPFQLFPDEVIVETDKITVVHRTLLFKKVHPVPLENMTSIAVTRGILFASVSFEITGFDENPGNITHLWPETAAKIKRYVVGLIQARKQNVDLSLISADEIRDYVEDIGKTSGEIETLPMA